MAQQTEMILLWIEVRFIVLDSSVVAEWTCEDDSLPLYCIMAGSNHTLNNWLTRLFLSI